GNKPVFEVIHAGLEAGIISKINPELELISFGPDMFAIHSSNEHLSIGSTDRIYRFLLEFIKAL
ncbi:MAG: aminoacyl-histidine dipeptidase, partial [Lentisphaeria bacterium]|nr:aminoacyl-histidine dipeptidase [Lentisphaeria bacterium]